MVTLAIYSLNVYIKLMESDNLMPNELLAFSKLGMHLELFMRCVAAVYTA